MATEVKEEVKQVEEEKKEEVKEASAETEKAEKEHFIPKGRMDELNQKYKDEKMRADALEKAAIDKEEQALKDDKRYKELYEKSQAKITELTPKAEALATAEETLKNVLEAQIALIPEDKRALIPDYGTVEERLRYIAANGDMLRKADAFDIGASSKGGKSDKKSVVLTDEQKKMAKNLNISQEDYAKKLE